MINKLDFEKPVLILENKINELKQFYNTNKLNTIPKINHLKTKRYKLLKKNIFKAYSMAKGASSSTSK